MFIPDTVSFTHQGGKRRIARRTQRPRKARAGRQDGHIRADVDDISKNSPGRGHIRTTMFFKNVAERTFFLAFWKNP
jgi:hypothetical protein